jgi:hypothetical protein
MRLREQADSAIRHSEDSVTPRRIDMVFDADPCPFSRHRQSPRSVSPPLEQAQGRDTLAPEHSACAAVMLLPRTPTNARILTALLVSPARTPRRHKVLRSHRRLLKSDQGVPAQCTSKHTATRKEPEEEGLSLTYSCPASAFPLCPLFTILSAEKMRPSVRLTTAIAIVFLAEATRAMRARTDRQPLRPESVTYVSGINRHLCVRNGHCR